MWPSTRFKHHRPLNIALLLTALILSGFTLKADAHALDFASLNLEQVTPNGWRIHFQQTNSVVKPDRAANNAGSQLQLQLPTHCQTGFSSHSLQGNNQESWQWQVACQPGTNPEWVSLAGSNESQVFFHRKTLEGDTTEKLYSAGTNRFYLYDTPPKTTPDAKPDTETSYLTMGISHIAVGYDHLAFVLLAVLIAGRLSAVFVVITAFTAGHCVTLIMASMNLISFNQSYVEWLIALSIVFLAAEIIRNRQTITLKQPAFIALLFGLVHGLGFASVLADVGLPEQNRLWSLILFNLGVEIGQVVFVLISAPLIYWLTRQSRTWPQKALVYSVGGVAGYWLVARTLLL